MNIPERINDLRKRIDRAKAGGGEKAVAKQHSDNKLTARERIERLLDPCTFMEMDIFVAHRCTNFNMSTKEIPAEAVVTGYGKIDQRPVYIFAQDFTIDYGDGSETQIMPPSESLKLIKKYYKAGNHKVTINVLDMDGDSYISSFLVKVENVAPVVYAGPHISTNNGHITKFCYFTDPGDDNYRIHVSFGDNTPTNYNYPYNGKHFVLEHIYNVIGTYYISVWVHDGNGGTGSTEIRVKYNVD